MKVVFFCMIFSFTAFANLPTGYFSGSGIWQDTNNHGGSYSGFVEVNENVVNIDYTWHGFTSPSTITFTTNGFDAFNVYYDGKVVGDGYCLENQCHYWIHFAGIHYDESISFPTDSRDIPYIVRKGLKDDGSLTTTWLDELNL